MTNHLHLLLRTGTLPLSRLMQRLLGAHARAFNVRHRRAGHLFQNRFGSTVVGDDPYLIDAVRYIHLNPVDAKIVADLDALDDYEWTGHAVLMGRRSYAAQDTDAVLSLFANDRTAARQAYRLSVADRLADLRPIDLEGGGLKRSLGCWESRQPLKRGRERWASDERILGDGDFVMQMLAEVEEREPSLVRVYAPDVVPALCMQVGTLLTLGTAIVKSRSCLPAAVAARAIVSWIAVVRLGAIPAQVARALGVSLPTVLRGVTQAPILSAKLTSPRCGMTFRGDFLPFRIAEWPTKKLGSHSVVGFISLF